MKKVFKLLVVLALVCIATICAVSCESNFDREENQYEAGIEYSNGLKCELNSDETSYTVVGIGTYTGDQLIIPGTCAGKPITSIGREAFAGCSNITSVSIPDSITSISRYAFYDCSGLTSLIIPNTVTNIDFFAFGNCSNLESITLPFVGKKGDGSSDNNFFGYIFGAQRYSENENYIPTGLKNVVITDSETVNARAFFGCSSITSITLPNDVVSIGTDSFKGCSNLTNFDMPESVTKIGSSAFEGCSNLKSITIPESIKTINSSAFKECINLTSVQITNIANWCGIEFVNSTANPLYYAKKLYLNNNLLTNLNVPSGVTHIGNYAFSNCTTLTDAIFSNTVEHIGISAFEGCYNITQVTLPESITTVDSKAFYNCYKLVEIYNSSSLDIRRNDDNGYIGYYSLNIYTPENGSSKLQLDSNGFLFYETEYIRYLVSYIGADKNISLPSIENNSKYEIYNYAFYNNTNIVSVAISDSISNVGAYAFEGCSNLEFNELDNAYYLGNIDNPYLVLIKIGKKDISNFIIPSDVRIIASIAFDGCENLTSLNFSNSIKAIGKSALYGCSNLESITLPFLGEPEVGARIIFSEIFSDPEYSWLSVPYTLKTVVVTGGSDIPSRAFSNCKSLTTIIIPSSIIQIGDYAFSGCSSLVDINIPNSITSIGKLAFNECSSLKSITIPNHVTSIGSYVLYKCFSLENVTIPFIEDINISFKDYFGNDIPSNIKNVVINKGNIIKDNAFLNCSNITSITIPDGIISIGKSAFSNCEKLISINIPNSVTSIGDSAFYRCSNLESINIPNNVTSIGDKAFYGCSNLESIIIPNNVTSIGNHMFYNCSNLSNITFTESIENIGECMFYGCSKLSNLTIPEGINSIGKNAFSYCSSLTNIIIPNSVTHIGEAAFSECSGLISIKIPFVGESKDGTENHRFRYIFGAVPKNLKSVIISGGSIIGPYAFGDCSNLTSITISDSITSIGDSAFQNCTSLESISIGTGVTKFGLWSFGGCKNLKSVYISDIASWCNISVENINCSPLYYANEIYLNNNLITELTIPSEITKINNYAFYGVSSITSLTVPDGVLTIGDYAFAHCANISTVAIGNDVKTIGYSAFRNCSAISSLSLGSGVVTIKEYAFRECSSISALTIPDSVTIIESSAFFGCEKIESLIIGSGVKVIEIGAFNGCKALKSVTFMNTQNWFVKSPSSANSERVSVTNTSTNATYFKSTYIGYSWKRN